MNLHIEIFSLSIIALNISNGRSWIRLFGYGFSVKNTRKHSELFSERNNYSKVLRVGRYLFKYLKPNNFTNV